METIGEHATVRLHVEIADDWVQPQLQAMAAFIQSQTKQCPLSFVHQKSRKDVGRDRSAGQQCRFCISV